MCVHSNILSWIEDTNGCSQSVCFSKLLTNRMCIDATWPVTLYLFISIKEGTKMFPLQISLAFSGSSGMYVAVFCCVFLYCGTGLHLIVIQENSS